MNEIEMNGVTYEFDIYGGSRGSRECPPEDPYFEITKQYVSDWDAFTDAYGANGEFPLLGTCLDDYLEQIERIDMPALDDKIFSETWNDNFDDDPD